MQYSILNVDTGCCNTNSTLFNCLISHASVYKIKIKFLALSPPASYVHKLQQPIPARPHITPCSNCTTITNKVNTAAQNAAVAAASCRLFHAAIKILYNIKLKAARNPPAMINRIMQRPSTICSPQPSTYSGRDCSGGSSFFGILGRIPLEN